MIDYDYPDIFLGEAVQKDLLITDGTVTVTDDEYEVTGDTVTITNPMLESEAFELHQSLNSSMQLKFGSCESASVTFVFHSTMNTIKGKTLKVYIIPNHEASKMLQLGVFKVYEDNSVRGADRAKRRVVAYDAMYDIINADVKEWYDTVFPDTTTTKTVKQIRDSFMTHFGITAETVTLINDNLTIKRSINPESLSGADVIKAICEINGTFGQITNEGKFRFVSLTNTREDIEKTEVIDAQFENYYAESITTLKIMFDNGTSYTFGQTSGDINTYIISGNMLINGARGNDIMTLYNAGNKICQKISGHYYVPGSVNCIGNPVREVGDPVRVWTRGDYENETYIFERRLSGIQALRDTYRASGEKQQTQSLNSTTSQVEQLSQEIEKAKEDAVHTAAVDFVETIRNIGLRLLDEPDVLEAEYDADNEQVTLKWEDPDDINTNEPIPCEWEGTVVVRKEGSAPMHKWDGTLITDSTTRDEYSVTALEDNTVEEGKTYYYGIFPYHIFHDDISNPIKHYRYTKVVKVVTEGTAIPIISTVEFDFEGSTVQTFTAEVSGSYLLEVWGASGGHMSFEDGRLPTSLGGYSRGIVELEANDTLYIYVGGQGLYNGVKGQMNPGGVNGGQSGGWSWRPYLYAPYPYHNGGGSGGATHIAKGTNRGALSNYSEHRDEILIVAGGGGGIIGDGWGSDHAGYSCGGGFKGTEGYTARDYGDFPSGGTQSTGYQFGLGEPGGNGQTGPGSGEGRGAGGGGWFGGESRNNSYAGDQTDTNAGGGGGSGYINTTLLTDAVMVGYGVETSDATSTKTLSTNNYSSTAEAYMAKEGNGYAKISLLDIS